MRGILREWKCIHFFHNIVGKKTIENKFGYNYDNMIVNDDAELSSL